MKGIHHATVVCLVALLGSCYCALPRRLAKGRSPARPSPSPQEMGGYCGIVTRGEITIRASPHHKGGARDPCALPRRAWVRERKREQIIDLAMPGTIITTNGLMLLCRQRVGLHERQNRMRERPHAYDFVSPLMPMRSHAPLEWKLPNWSKRPTL